MTGTSDRSVIDVVDPLTGQPVGTAERGEALAAGLPMRPVHIFLFDDRHRLLLQVLGRERDRHPLLRGSSVAGFDGPGDDPRILEPGHVEGLEYWELTTLDAEIAHDPAAFTNTFLQVHSWWGERSARV